MRRTVVNARGQVTIPVELRKQLEIKRGTRVTWSEEKGQLIMAPMTLRRIKKSGDFSSPNPASHQCLRSRSRSGSESAAGKS